MSVLTPGQHVRVAREKAHLTREELAREAGVSTSTVARLELNDRLPKPLALARIATQLGLPITDLITAHARSGAA